MYDLLIKNEPDSVYHSKRKTHLTSHKLMTFMRCPKLYYAEQAGLIENEDTKSFIVGRAAHCLILEGEKEFRRRYGVGPINEKTGKSFGTGTKACADWQLETGRTALGEDDYGLVYRLAGAVSESVPARRLLASGSPEVVARRMYCDKMCQSRLDWVIEQPFMDYDCGIVDLKTCDDVDFFVSSFFKYMYDNQLAFYREMVTYDEMFERTPAVHIIAVEKKQPHRCGVWKISPDILDTAASENRAAIKRLITCEESGTWPTGYEDILTIA